MAAASAGLTGALLTVLLWANAAATSQPSSAPSEPDRVAAGRLAHDARSLGHQRQAVARTGRVRALLEYARGLCPDDVEVNTQLAELYDAMGDSARALGPVEVRLRRYPDDFATGCRWLRLSLDGLDTSDQRIAWLDKTVVREDLSPPLRAEAAAQLCNLYLARGEKSQAGDACTLALRLAPSHPGALACQGKLPGQDAPAEAARRAVALVRGNPRDLQAAWELAQRAQEAGLRDRALTLYEQADAIAKTRLPGAADMEALAFHYSDAMLDAGQAKQAVELLGPLLTPGNKNLDLRGLMVEALRATGEDAAAAAQVRVMDGLYNEIAATDVGRTPSAKADRAWFNLHFARKPDVALAVMRQISDPQSQDNPFFRRVRGAAQLASKEAGEVDKGAKALASLAGQDPFAAAYLAQHYYDKAQPPEGEEALPEEEREALRKEGDKALRQGAAGGVRAGPGWRMLVALLSKHGAGNVASQPTTRMAAVADGLKDLPDEALAMGRHPEKFVTVALGSPRTELVLGEPVEVTVEISNISSQPVPLGAYGLFDPTVRLSLAVEGDLKADLPDLTVVALPAPRYLPAGGKVAQTVRLDVGPAEQLLMTSPLAELRLTVSALPDPLQRGEKVTSSVPDLSVQPLRLTRRRLFDTTGDSGAVKYALAYIIRDLREGDLPTQVRAARQAAALLAHVRLVETGKAKAVFPDALTKPWMLSVTRAFLEAPSPVVRAETLSALNYVELDAHVIRLLNPGDDSPLVRMRLIELLSAKATPGHENLLKHFLEDPDAGVRRMAAALAGRAQ